jgi:hypothetical protein
MKKLEIIELAPLWNRGGGNWSSVPLADDRVQDLFAAIREAPYKLIIKANDRKRAVKSPDAFLLAVPVRSKEG